MSGQPRQASCSARAATSFNTGRNNKWVPKATARLPKAHTFFVPFAAFFAVAFHHVSRLERSEANPAARYQHRIVLDGPCQCFWRCRAAQSLQVDVGVLMLEWGGCLLTKNIEAFSAPPSFSPAPTPRSKAATTPWSALAIFIIARCSSLQSRPKFLDYSI
jgi:hypothetical protein